MCSAFVAGRVSGWAIMCGSFQSSIASARLVPCWHSMSLGMILLCSCWRFYTKQEPKQETRRAMGDKGGRKDKEKSKKQDESKQKKQAQSKADKQPKRRP